MKGKALRRVLAAGDQAVARLSPEKLPNIMDSTEFITPEMAQEMLNRNRGNRPVNWNKVEEFSKIMAAGKWQLHAQGIILDSDGNIITGQTRLWAVVYSGTTGVYFRVSRGSPRATAFVIDRGRPQSARDLATRRTEVKHSPVEASLARCICILRGNTKPSTDAVAEVIVEKSTIFAAALHETKRDSKKNKAVLMVLAAICEVATDPDYAAKIAKMTVTLAERLELELHPHSARECWGKGTAFGLALATARRLL